MLRDEYALKRALLEELTYEATPEDLQALQRLFMGAHQNAEEVATNMNARIDLLAAIPKESDIRMPDTPAGWLFAIERIVESLLTGVYSPDSLLMWLKVHNAARYNAYDWLCFDWDRYYCLDCKTLFRIRPSN